MARSPFSKPARPKMGKVSPRTPASPKPKTNQRPVNVGARGQGTGTSPGFGKRIVTTDVKKSVTPKSVSTSVRVPGGKTAKPPTK